ncbi:MAG: hypothetical protein ACTHMS_22585 [Jatrophihabitans sp.]|uniref:hypothetical protein n=1 Tax=Jatrophihabitans sp. TaxID=1932789 RepID=UPI003F81AB74
MARSSTAGYSATPQARKLGLKPGTRFAAIAAPDGWALREPPPLEPADDSAGGADVLLHFVRTRVEVVPALEAAAPRIFPAGALWVAWPRKAAGHVSDVDEHAIRDAALTRRLVDVKVAAIDDDWSGLKIVWRVEHRGAGGR